MSPEPMPAAVRLQPQVKTRLTADELPRHVTVAKAYRHLYQRGLALLIDRDGLCVVRVH